MIESAPPAHRPYTLGLHIYNFHVVHVHWRASKSYCTCMLLNDSMLCCHVWFYTIDLAIQAAMYAAIDPSRIRGVARRRRP